MNVYLKYCGGCNETYNRVSEVEKLKKELPDLCFYYDDNHVCDIALIVCGCSNACVCMDKIKIENKFILKDKEDFYKIKSVLLNKLQRN